MNNDCGIYCFENLINHKKYIGQSDNIERRKKTHLGELTKNKHKNFQFQNDWNLCGKNNFRFYKILLLPKIDFILDIFEKFFIWILNSHVSKNGYNISWGGENGIKGFKHSEETILKMSGKNSHNYGKHPSDEIKRKMSKNHWDSSGENNPMYGIRGENHPLFGRHHTDESKKKMSENTTGSKNSQFGKIRSDEHSKKISEANYGPKNWRFGKKSSKASSQYYGIHKDIQKNKYIRWVIEFWINGKKIRLGSSKSEIEAAKIYDKYIIENHLPNPLNFLEDYKQEKEKNNL